MQCGCHVIQAGHCRRRRETRCASQHGHSGEAAAGPWPGGSEPAGAAWRQCPSQRHASDSPRPPSLLTASGRRPSGSDAELQERLRADGEPTVCDGHARLRGCTCSPERPGGDNAPGPGTGSEQTPGLAGERQEGLCRAALVRGARNRLGLTALVTLPAGAPLLWLLRGAGAGGLQCAGHGWLQCEGGVPCEKVRRLLTPCHRLDHSHLPPTPPSQAGRAVRPGGRHGGGV